MKEGDLMGCLLKLILIIIFLPLYLLYIMVKVILILAKNYK